MTPSNSTLASAGLGLPAAIVIAWLAGQFQLDMGAEVQTALGVIISTLVGYFFEGGKRAQPPVTAANPQGGFARPLLLTLLIVCSLPFVASLHGCVLGQTMQAQAPLSLDQRLSLAYDQYTAAVTSIGNNVHEHRMSGADGQKALKAADDARVALDMARGAPDVQTAEGQLALAANALREVQKYLDKRAAR